MIKRTLFSVLTTFICIFSAVCQAKVYTANDVLAFTRVSCVVVSPNAKQVAYVTFARDKQKQHMWRYTLDVKTETGSIKHIATAPYIGSVRWSPNGHQIAYITANRGVQSVYLHQFSNQESYPLVSLSQPIEAIQWSPAGKQIAFVAMVKPVKNVDTGLVEARANPGYSQIFITSSLEKTTNYHAVTSHQYILSAGVFGNSFSWSPDANKIAYSYQTSFMPSNKSNGNIAILDLSTHKTTTLAYCNRHICRSPMYSPNGRLLAFESNVLAKGKKKLLLRDIDKYKLICVANEKQNVRCLRNTFDENPNLLGWSANGHSVYVGELYKTTGPQLYAIDLNPAAAVKKISKQDDFIEPLTMTLNRSNTVVGFGYEQLNVAPEVYTADLATFGMKKVTSINLRYNKKFGDARIINWLSSDDTPIQGLLLTPVNYNPHKKYPLYVDIHGGPVGAQARRYLGGADEYSQAITPTDCAANILSLGYVILQTNYRGSGGYGLNFRVKNFGDLGRGDYQDILTGIDALTKQGIVDQNHMVIAGWSYGGYLTTWAISQSHRFKEAIDGDGLTDFISYTGTSDDVDFLQRYLGSYYWNGNEKLYWSLSPIAHVKHIHTPLLILQGQQDERVPLTQSQEIYTALTVLHEPVSMLVAPNAGHVPTDPGTIGLEIDAIDRWLTK